VVGTVIEEGKRLLRYSLLGPEKVTIISRLILCAEKSNDYFATGYCALKTLPIISLLITFPTENGIIYSLLVTFSHRKCAVTIDPSRLTSNSLLFSTENLQR
jgi:hypothetical protein